jgi:hypothetical protein
MCAQTFSITKLRFAIWTAAMIALKVALLIRRRCTIVELVSA